MVISEFKLYTDSLHVYDAEEMETFQLMTDEELKEYQYEVENSTGTLCDWDHIRAVITFRKKIHALNESLKLQNKVPPKENRPQGFII